MNLELLIVLISIIGLLLLCLGSTITVGVSLIIIAMLSFILFTDSAPLPILPNILWNQTNSSTMMALPLFILMGEILFRSRISENLFKGLSPWITFLPGRLIHVNIIACGLFAAVSGSSAATTATVGKITLPELFKRNYNRSLSIGTLAGAGTLGFLIPPSILLIIYGIMANVSIGQLFIAGIIPGGLIMVCFIVYVMIRCILNPSLAPKTEKYTWDQRIKSLPLVLPVVILIGIVLGSIYTGWATPTEAAAVGVLGSLLFAIVSRSMTKEAFKDAVLGAVKTTGMIMLIVFGAYYLTSAVAYIGIPDKMTEFIATLGLSGYTLILVLTLMYIILGSLLDGFSIIVLTLPIALPLITSAGFDSLWFGIFLIIMIEIAQITPPIGFNLFVINGITTDNVAKIAKSALPSLLLLLVVVVLMTVYPQFIYWLPNLMM